MIVFLNKSNSLSWALVPQVTARIRTFIYNEQADGDPDQIAAAAEKYFVQDQPMMLMVAILFENEVVGHCLASIDEFTGKRYLTILQLNVDKKYRKQLWPEIQKNWATLLEWGKSNYATEVQLLTPTKSRVRLFSRYFGMNEHRILMRGKI